MYIQSIKLHRICLQLKAPFVTSNGAYTDRETVLVEIQDEQGIQGWGECVAFSTPWYTEETVDTAWIMLEQFLIPLLLHQSFNHPSELAELFKPIRRNYMAKAGLEMAVWDLYSRLQRIPLAQAIGGVKPEIEAGVAVGLQPTDTELYRVIEQYIQDGYRRVKVKIKPGQDVELIRGIRRAFPELPLMADANSAYTLADIDRLKRLDEFGLLMIEQPLGADDIIDHAKLQQYIDTPVCLDESIVTLEDARKAIELGSCKIINVKLGRVGGFNEALHIHDLCRRHGIALWCGGMLETGIGRAHNIALASLSQFVLPGDISASSRYWERDVILPEVTIKNGKVTVTSQPGIGYEVDEDYIRTITLKSQLFDR